ncbi:MAG: hypothetical protein KBE09_04690 [Candidatus Pacebacteria bacterium]|nr:hypothetical protein [Candidatus Paceibacterota bacterium]
MLHAINEDLAAVLSLMVFLAAVYWLFTIAVYRNECSPRTLVCAAVVTTTALSMRLTVPVLEYFSPVLYALFIVIAFIALKRAPVPRSVARLFKW